MLIRQRFIGAIELANLYAISAIRSPAHKKRFNQVETFCLFIGYPRSGHTLIGSLLDAHRNVVIALELDALRLIRHGFSKYQLFYLLLENSRVASKAGRQWTGYSYQVPNQWQGKYETIKVIGDKKGGESSKQLVKNINLIDQLQRNTGVKVKIIHVVRNPYDNISTMLMRGDAMTLTGSIDEYFMLAEVVAKVQALNTSYEVTTVHHESFIQEPMTELRKLCEFLGVHPSEDYLEDCAGIVFESPHKTRHDIQWDRDSLNRVEQCKQKFDFLRDYCF